MKTLAVIGGGAAGFFGAIAASENPNLRVVLFEKNNSVLNKVRISGGGRCNVTHAAEGNAHLLRGYPRGANFLKKLFLVFNHQDTFQWFESRGVPLKIEADGRVFPVSNSSQDIINCLLQSARNIEIRTSYGVKAIQPQNNSTFELSLADGNIFLADKVLFTTGGHPQVSGYEIITNLGQEIVPPVPSLFTFNLPDSFLKELPGVVAHKATVRLNKEFQASGPTLLTHWGMSGPAVLKLSAFAARFLAEKGYQFSGLINWTGENPETVRQQLSDNQKKNPLKHISNTPVFGLPSRLWEKLVADLAPRWADVPARQLNLLTERLCNFPFEASGKTTFKEEFVTAGGVALAGVRSDTLESRVVPNLFFAGEILDIDGITGGYNFQAAWTTGYIVGKAIARTNTSS